MPAKGQFREVVTEQSGRSRARRAYAWQPCEVCGGEAEGRHHRDSDRLNNAPDNIAFLCRQHHKDAHQLTDRKVGGGPRPHLARTAHEDALPRMKRAAEMQAAGIRVRDIATALGVHRNTIWEWLREYSAEIGGSHTGETKFRVKLTQTEVIEIRRLRAAGASTTDLARQFVVSRQLISAICLRRVWQEVP